MFKNYLVLIFMFVLSYFLKNLKYILANLCLDAISNKKKTEASQQNIIQYTGTLAFS